MAVQTWGRSRTRITTHAKHPTLRHTGLCGRPSMQSLDASKHPDHIDCKLCKRILDRPAPDAPEPRLRFKPTEIGKDMQILACSCTAKRFALYRSGGQILIACADCAEQYDLSDLNDA